MKFNKEDIELVTDFYMWMVENDYDHNVRIRVENKAELFLRDRNVTKQCMYCEEIINKGDEITTCKKCTE